MEAEIRAEFESSGFSIGGAGPEDAAQILSTLLSYCINYKFSPADLVSNWEVYYLNRQLDGLKLERSYLDGFLSHLQNEVKERLIEEEANLHVYSSNDVDMLLNNSHADEAAFLDTPGSKQEKLPGESSSTELTPLTSDRPSSSREAKTNGCHITPFATRVNKFTQQYVLNSDNAASMPSKREAETTEDELIRRIQPSQRCSLQVQRSQPEPGCRFMYDRMEDRFNYLEDRIRKSATLFSASGLCGEPADATLASEEKMFAVGMVTCDGEGRLNEKSILLQGSAEHSRGERVRLDLKDLDHFSLFPGQVVGIEGHNPSGHCFVASKLIDLIPVSVGAQLPSAKKQAVDNGSHHQNSDAGTLSRALSSVIAAGPYTTTDNLLFEPLQELLAYACRKQPQLLILMGPFIDSDHPVMKKGTVDQTFHDIFYFEVLRKIQDFTQYLGNTVCVILIPSIRDAHHDFVFPQISSLANPSFFSSNQIHFGCCTVDILKQISGEEISHKPPNGKPGDRIGGLATHILKQQSYYPLYPPAAGVPLNFSLAKEALEISLTPDVLLLPSDLAPFVKVLSLGEGRDDQKQFICLNPGRLAKGIGGGTFVELYYNEDTSRTNASIIRI
ncbi:DNA polymerase alpha subunit B-like isoform X2 [Panicum virgatum]|uniref:DNA polymerase alpha subunit B-like isoform X2 n=1 Tax=Panicum virgatum TaxID=38727 RepID=UPI0019D668F9|nr:DNA polymerase alpha subunit B-like isoform X2 [Panicum virgatum]